MSRSDTHGEITGRYLASFRQAEINLVCESLRAGKSLVLVGVAGAGKSNVVNFLHEGGVFLGQYLNAADTPACFPVLDGNKWQGTAGSLWQNMIVGLRDVAGDVDAPAEDRIRAISDEVGALLELKSLLAKICRERNTQVMFILDDFDVALATGPLTVLEGLNSLRSEGNRDRLSYLILTKRLPHVLGRELDLEHRSKFFDLFRNDIYPLGLYSAADSMHMLEYLNHRHRRPFRLIDLHPIHYLSGGHAHLLRTIFDTCRERGAERAVSGDVVARYAGYPDVQTICTKILLGLHPEEQNAAVCLARGQGVQQDEVAVDLLLWRGLLLKPNPVEWFSPIFERFLATYRPDR